MPPDNAVSALQASSPDVGTHSRALPFAITLQPFGPPGGCADQRAHSLPNRQLRPPLYDGHGNMVATLARSGTGFAVNDRRSFDAWGSVRTGNATGDPKGRYVAECEHVQPLQGWTDAIPKPRVGPPERPDPGLPYGIPSGFVGCGGMQGPQGWTDAIPKPRVGPPERPDPGLPYGIPSGFVGCDPQTQGRCAGAVNPIAVNVEPISKVDCGVPPLKYSSQSILQERGLWGLGSSVGGRWRLRRGLNPQSRSPTPAPHGP